MPNPSKTLHEVEETITSVIDSLIDGQEGFQKTGEQLKNESLREFFLAESLTRAEFRGDLEEVLHQEGVHDIKESGTVGGTLRRAWGDLKAALGASEHTILETAEKAEDAAVKGVRRGAEGQAPVPGARAFVEASGPYPGLSRLCQGSARQKQVGTRLGAKFNSANPRWLCRLMRRFPSVQGD